MAVESTLGGACLCSIALTVGCLAWTGCRPVAPPAPGTVDLLAPAAAPVLLWETGEIRPPEPSFVSGLYRARSGTDGVWAGADPLRIDLGFLWQRPRTLELEGLAFSWPGAPPLGVSVFLDGVLLEEIEWGGGWETHRLAVPGKASFPGWHRLELRFDRAVAPREVLPGSGGSRRLSLQLRAVRVAPVAPQGPRPEWDEGQLVLPCGSQARWPLWVREGTRLRSDVERLGDAEPVLAVERDSEDGRLLSGDDADLGSAGPLRLVLECRGPPGSALRVRRLWLEEPVEPPSRSLDRPPGKVLIAVCDLRDGFPVVPCAEDAGAARRCLWSGLEAAAFGFEAPPAVDAVGRSIEEVSAFLAAAPAPAVALLLAPEAPAEAVVEEVRSRLPDVSIVLASRAPKRGRARARFEGFPGVPGGASHLDLLPTSYALAGREPGPRFSGIDLLPALTAPGTRAVRPLAVQWRSGGASAWTADRRFEVPEPSPGAAGSVTEEVVTRLVELRREELAWLER